MRVLSLFDGLACGMIAMLGAGVEVDRYVAYEIDKYAIKTATHNFPMIEQKGDVFTADFTEYEGFDWLVGGSPCTYWSIAQKNGRETEASGMGWELFQQYVRALHEAKPKYFIYENNKSMSKAIRASIDEAFGFEAVLINSALVSAQNRQRLYWVGKRNADGSYSKVNVEQPIDRGILLKDVLDGNTDREKARAVIGSVGRTTTREYFDKQQGTMAYEPVGYNLTFDEKSWGTIKRCAEHLRSVWGKACEEPVRIPDYGTVDKAIPEIVKKCGYVPEMFNAYNKAEIIDKSPTLSTGSMVTSSCAVNRLENICCYAQPCEWDEYGKPTKAISQADGKTYRVHKVENGLITIKGKEYPIKLADGYYIIRKLTVRECMRLQTVPEWYEFPVSDSAAYKMLGNGWTCEVIIHLIKSCLASKVDEPEFREQIKFF